MEVMSDLAIFDVYDASSSDDEEEYNPFNFENNDQVFHSFERIFENQFAVRDKKWILVPRQQLPIIKKSLIKIKRWFAIIKKEHEIFQILQNSCIELKAKVENQSQIIVNIELASQIKLDQYNQAFLQMKEENASSQNKLDSQLKILQEELEERNKKILKQQRSIQILINDEDSLYQRKQYLTEELSVVRKELQQFKQIQKMGMIEINIPITEDQKGGFSTLELLLNSKVKGFLLSFLTLDDTLAIIRTSKKLYFSVAPPKILIPHAVKSKLVDIRQEVKLLMHKENEYNSILSTCPKKNLKQSMMKIYVNKVNLTDNIGQPLKEALRLISGDQFIGASSIRTESHQFQDNLDNFLYQQKQFYSSALEQLKTGFPWKSFFDDLVENNLSGDPNVKSIEKLQMQSQTLTQRLFELGTLCSNDAGVFGMYLSQIQRCLAQLYVFSQNLTIETQNLQSMSYFVMQRFLLNFKYQKILIEELEDTKEKLNTYSESRNFLNLKLHENEKSLIQKQNEIVDKSNQIIQKDQKIQQCIEKLEISEKIQNKQSDQLKILALKTLNYKNKYNELANQHNELMTQFLNVSKSVGDIVQQY